MEERICKRCGVAPIGIGRRMYCDACAKDAEWESTKRCWERRKAKLFAMRNEKEPGEKVQVDASGVVACKGCYYWRPASGINCCHYCLETGMVRGIPPIECYKHEGTPYKKGKWKRRAGDVFREPEFQERYETQFEGYSG